MTKQSEVLDNPKYVPVLDHGFVGLIDHMGSDAAIVQAARVSYGVGTKTVRADRGLIRYLIRHGHTSPVEMCEVKLHIKLPIFVMRQLVRHRTASLNEYSARYSELSDEFYMPADDFIAPQSTENKQGRGGYISDEDRDGVRWMLDAAYDHSYGAYRALLNDREHKSQGNDGPLYDCFESIGDNNPATFSEEYPGVARETARMVMPVGGYTELYWKQDLHNLFHMIRLRADSHAQKEIVAYAQAVYDLVKPLFPYACEAFEDYVRGGLKISRMEKELLDDLLGSDLPARIAIGEMVDAAGGVKDFALSRGMSERELADFVKNFNLELVQ